MQIVVYSARSYDRRFFEEANADGRHALTFLDARLDVATAAAASGPAANGCASDSKPGRPAGEMSAGSPTAAPAVKSCA